MRIENATSSCLGNGRKALLGLFFLFCLSSHAARIVKWIPDDSLLALRMEPNEPVSAWKLKEPVCLYDVDGMLACGSILRIGNKGLILAIASAERPFKEGDAVQMRRREVIPAPRNLNLGYCYPFLACGHMQEALTKNVSYGIMGVIIYYHYGQGNIKGFAPLAVINWHARPYRGVWTRFGMGLHIYNIQEIDDGETRQTSTHGLFYGTVGYRLTGNSGWNASISGGGFFFLDPLIRSRLKHSPFFPTVAFEFGLAF